MTELPELQVDQHEAAQQPVVEHEIDEEVVAVERDALLPRDEAEPLAQFEHELLEMVDDRLFQVAFAPVGTVGQTEEFENERILHNILRLADLLALVGEREDIVFLTTGSHPLVQAGSDLAFEFAAGPALAGGFGFVEGAQ